MLVSGEFLPQKPCEKTVVRYLCFNGIGCDESENEDWLSLTESMHTIHLPGERYDQPAAQWNMITTRSTMTITYSLQVHLREIETLESQSQRCCTASRTLTRHESPRPSAPVDSSRCQTG